MMNISSKMYLHRGELKYFKVEIPFSPIEYAVLS